MAASFVKHNNGTIGLLVGKTDGTVGGEPIHQWFQLRPNAFKPPKRVRRKSVQNAQERYGLHSFKRGNLVEWTKAEAEEPVQRAAIFGVIYAEPVPSDNEVRKILVLYDVEADLFFLGAWPAWRRLAKNGVADFDCDNDQHVQFVSHEECETMLASFRTSTTLEGISTRRQAVAKAGEPPPQIKVQRAKVAEEAAAAARAAEKAAERAKAGAERAKAAERAKGSGKGHSGNSGGKGGGKGGGQHSGKGGGTGGDASFDCPDDWDPRGGCRETP